MAGERIEFTLNGRPLDVWVQPSQTLLEVLRDSLMHTEVKLGCAEGVCGTCTVLMDGQPVSSCLLFAVQLDGHDVTTLAGVANEPEVAALQERFLVSGAAQCGFCTPGMVLTAHYILQHNTPVDRAELSSKLSGNLCRCTGYVKILEAIESHQAAREAAGE